MIQSDYALSYNVKNSAIKILKPLCLYTDWQTLIPGSIRLLRIVVVS